MGVIEIYIAINFFIIGTLFGSFFSLANYRIPRKKDIVFTRSFCPKCNHNLGFWDLIPVLSFIFQGGKCRYCKAKINFRYLFLELASGFAFLLFYLVFEISIYTFIAIVIYIYLVMLTGCHLNKKNMMYEELEKLKKENKLSKKSGVFTTEIIVAAVVFAIAVSVTYASYISSLNTKVKSINENTAMFECTKNVELALGIEYEDLSTFTSYVVIDGISYITIVNVQSITELDSEKEDYIKYIEATTEYMYNGEKHTYTINTIKKKV